MTRRGSRQFVPWTAERDKPAPEVAMDAVKLGRRLESVRQACEDLRDRLVDPGFHPGLMIDDAVDAVFGPSAPDHRVCAGLDEIDEERPLLVDERPAIVIRALRDRAIEVSNVDLLRHAGVVMNQQVRLL